MAKAKFQFVLPKNLNSQEPPSISKDTDHSTSISDRVMRAEGLFNKKINE